jgi:hypothetical protein
MAEETKPSASLALQTVDYVASAVRAVAGAAPFVGSLLVEISGHVIPNQRVERIARFAALLESRLSSVEQSIVRAQVENANFTDLMEDALRQAARAVSEERKEYIASLVARGLTHEDVEFQESKHLLRVLGELSDVEVIWLRSYAVRTLGGDQEFRHKHADVLRAEPSVIGAGQQVLDKAALQSSYTSHFLQLGVLEPEYQLDSRTKQPEYDSFTGRQKVKGYVLTSFGRLLLRHIGRGSGLTCTSSGLAALAFARIARSARRCTPDR